MDGCMLNMKYISAIFDVGKIVSVTGPLLFDMRNTLSRLKYAIYARAQSSV